MIQTLLSETASRELVQELLGLVEQAVEVRMAQKEKRYLIQKEVYKEYGCCHRDLANWEAMGLKKFRRGKSWVYDRRDIEEIFEILKR